MSIFFIVILIFFGISLIVLEILIVPGLIVGIAGAIFMIMGIMWAWQIFGQTTGIIVGISSMIILGITLYLATKSAFWKRFSLKNHSEGRMNEIEVGAVMPGESGHAISSLRPMGTVRVNGKKFEAMSEGELIPANYPIIVIRVEPGRIVVKPKMD